MPLSFERSLLVGELVNILRGVNGDVSYESISKKLKLPVERIKSGLASAQRILLKESILFGTVRGVGLRRLGNTERVDESDANIRKIGRASARYDRRLDTVEFESLSNFDKLRATTNRTVLHLIKQQSAYREPKGRSTAAMADTKSAADNLVTLGKKPAR